MSSAKSHVPTGLPALDRATLSRVVKALESQCPQPTVDVGRMSTEAGRLALAYESGRYRVLVEARACLERSPADGTV